MELNCNYDKHCFEIHHTSTNLFIHTPLLSFNHACHEHSLVRLLDRAAQRGPRICCCQLDGSNKHWCDKKLAGYHLLGRRDEAGGCCNNWQHMDLQQQRCDLDGKYRRRWHEQLVCYHLLGRRNEAGCGC